MNGYRYILQPYRGIKTRFRCPVCDNRQKTFARYIDTETGEYLSHDVGKCNRDSNCGYHYTPKQYFQDNPGVQTFANPNIFHARVRTVAETLPIGTSFIPYHIFEASQKAYKDNYFIQYLNMVLGVEITNQLIARYFIGSCKHWPGGTVFWQIDTDGKIRTGKLMLYRPDTGKRVKEPYNHINWVHALRDGAKNNLYPGYNLKQCFFGEHLLQTDTVKPVAIVESEKTAIIASVYLPDFIWLACGCKDGLNAEKCKILQGRKVILYPDLRCYDKWNSIKKMLVLVSISDLLERHATEADKANGLDLADYLLRFDHREFIKENTPHTSKAVCRLNEKDPTNPNVFDGLNTGDHTISDCENRTKPYISRVYSKCFEGNTGKIYIQNPSAPERYAVYNSVEAYNNRLQLPEYISSILAVQDHKQVMVIDVGSLMIKPSVP